jgi:hypothetical protein
MADSLKMISLFIRYCQALSALKDRERCATPRLVPVGRTIVSQGIAIRRDGGVAPRHAGFAAKIS